MSSIKFLPPLPDVVPERDSLIVRHYAERLEGLGLSDRTTGPMTGTARHIAVWPAAGGREGRVDGDALERLSRNSYGNLIRTNGVSWQAHRIHGSHKNLVPIISDGARQR